MASLAKCKTSVYVLTEICLQWSKRLGPRFQVDEDKLNILDEVKDVHILTGCLKLFFRELKEPLIPWNIVGTQRIWIGHEKYNFIFQVEKLYAAVILTNSEEKSVKIKDLIESNMVPSHQAVLNILLRHLLKVTGFKAKICSTSPTIRHIRHCIQMFWK